MSRSGWEQKCIDCAVNLSLSFADVRNHDGSPSLETNRHHRRVAEQHARELLEDYQNSLFREAFPEKFDD